MSDSFGNVMVTLSEEQLQLIINQTKREVLSDVEERIRSLEKVMELPPVANENQIRKTLQLGNTKVKVLLKGITPLFLGGSTALYDRVDIREAIDNAKIKV